MDPIVIRLNQAKRRKGMTLSQLAQSSGLSAGTVNKIMSGELKSIKPEKLEKLARALDVSVEWLMQPVEIEEDVHFSGLVKMACITPDIRVGDIGSNVTETARLLAAADRRGVRIAVLPELCITGYTCGDLFFQDTLRNGAIAGLRTLCERTEELDILYAVGLPLCAEGKLYNVAAVVHKGRVLGFVPKQNLPNYNEFMEKRYFCAYSGENILVEFYDQKVPFGNKLLFADTQHPEVSFSVELCEDIWVARSPSISHSAAGANAILNLSASNETIVKADYRKKMVEIQSAKCGVIYAYCSAGMSESTSATVYSAHNMICENGECIAESEPFGEGLAECCADFDFIQNERARLTGNSTVSDYTIVHFALTYGKAERVYDPMPFVPTKSERARVCERALDILAYGLVKRIEHIHAKRLVIGISGGSDSTLALLVCVRALKKACRPTSDILGVTMPCFGTGKRTLHNSVALCEALGTELRTIDISAAVTQHLKDIGHPLDVTDVTYENAQARERTQVLMDIANAVGGLVIGTGDMSEAALGWSTFNGDQMSMYSVISSVPKTLVKTLLCYCRDNAGANVALANTLTDIIDTPVSPELLPPDSKGNISQITEESVGPYELHDYFLFMMVRKGFTPYKVLQLACLSFEGKYSPETIRHWLEFFIRRFFSQQFKRSCTPDSVRLGSVDLSKYSLRMPSDACPDLWLASLAPRN